MADDIRKLQLEIGGSFFELIEFSLTRRLRGRTIKGIYGVNVAKVREVVRLPKINPLASRIKGVAGVFELRGIPIPAVHLSCALGDDEAEPKPNQQIIVTEFSQKRAGFIVDQTHRIRRVAWEKVLPPSADAGTCINGMTLIENNEFLFILDLERILITLEVAGGGSVPYAASPATGSAPAHGEPAATHGDFGGLSVLLVDDSSFIRNGVKQARCTRGHARHRGQRRRRGAPNPRKDHRRCHRPVRCHRQRRRDAAHGRPDVHPARARGAGAGWNSHHSAHLTVWQSESGRRHQRRRQRLCREERYARALRDDARDPRRELGPWPLRARPSV